MGTRTSKFGVSRREGHDATAFYGRAMCSAGLPAVLAEIPGIVAQIGAAPVRSLPGGAFLAWRDQVYCHTSADMRHIPDGSVALAFTSPPYNVGKEYDENQDLVAYLRLIAQVGAQIYRVLVPGGRYVVNIANVGRKPYYPLHALFYGIHAGLGFLPAGEIIWVKARAPSGSCAWGSWQSAKAPRLRDVHEYLLVFAKELYSRPDRGESDISRSEFLSATVSVWEIPAESARRVGHPAPFPVDLAKRVIKLFSYVGDVVLDPFVGSGSTLVAAKLLGRHFVGYDIAPQYCALAAARLEEVKV